MDGLLIRGIEFAMPDPGSRRHPLHIARPDHRTGAKAVLVLQSTVQDIGEDLHIAVRMGWEAASRRDLVLVDDAERSEAHVRWVMVVAKRKAVLAIEPAKIRPAPLCQIF